MDFYNNLKEKQKAFDCKRIDTLDELKAFISEQNDYKPKKKSLRFGDSEVSSDDVFGTRSKYIIYRGIKESKYHLNTSLQLHWKEIIDKKKNITQLGYLSALVGILRNNDTIKQYEEGKADKFTDIGILALMQHYGLPTPLMDWTSDIITGLNFASDGMTDGKEENEISNYVSLYYINLMENHELLQASYQKLLENATEKIQEIVSSLNKGNIDYTDGSLNRLFQLKDMGIDHIYIDYAEDAPQVTDIFGSTLDLINPNLQMQKGAFIINLNEEYFLEQLWNKKTDSDNDVVLNKKTIIDQNTGIEIQIEISQNPYAKGIIPNTKISCADIKKSVLKEWLSNGGKLNHYDEGEESLKIKSAVKHEYDEWLNK